MSLVGNVPLVNDDRTAVREGTGETEASKTIGQHVTPGSHGKPASLSSKPSEKPLEHASSETSEEEQEKRDQEVHDLARKFTTHSNASNVAEDPFVAEKDSTLDPLSSHFKPRSWLKSLLNLTSRYPDRYKQRMAGFAFKNLNVHGFGSSLDYQKSVANVILHAFGLIRGLFGFGQRRIDILRDLEGLVHHGEMLVVLGPPGR